MPIEPHPYKNCLSIVNFTNKNPSAREGWCRTKTLRPLTHIPPVDPLNADRGYRFVFGLSAHGNNHSTIPALRVNYFYENYGGAGGT